jgi:tRNA (guanine-N7-)-methyltransferase
METRSVRSYRLRGSRITPSQATALDRFWPIYGVEIPEGKLDLPALFPDVKEIVMEIGFGMGEATALIGRDFPILVSSPSKFTFPVLENLWQVSKS